MERGKEKQKMHLGTPRNNKVFVTIRGLTYIFRFRSYSGGCLRRPKPPFGRGCNGEFSRAKPKKSFGSTYTKKVKRKKRHKAQFVPPPKSAIFTFDDGGQYPPKVIILRS